MEVGQKNNTKEQIINHDKEVSEFDKCILNIVKKEGYTTYDITKKQLSQNGGNYLGVLYEVDVKGKTKEGEKTTSIFVKESPPYQVDIGVSIDEVYAREKFIYTELAQIYDELQNEAAIPKENRFKIAKCYNEALPKALFLENLTRKGFRTAHRMDVMTLDYAEESIKQLARFHGLSFALQAKRPDYFNKVLKPIEFGMKRCKEHDDLQDGIFKIALKQLDCCVRDRLENELKPYMKKYLGYLSDKDIFCCFVHGDYRPNNILFKETNGKVTEAVAVDYQFSHYGCPVLDFIYFIYSGTDLEFRKQHLPYLKDLYHDTLTEFLNQFKISVDSVFPRSRFDELFESKKDFGLAITLFYGPITFSTEEKNVDLSNDGFDGSALVVDERFKDRLYGAVKEFFDV